MSTVLFLSDKAVGQQMSGLGLRVHELAKALKNEHRVTVVGPGTGFWRLFSSLLAAEIVVVQIYFLRFYWVLLARLLGKRLVVDAYSPFYLEHLETEKGDPGRSALLQRIDALRINFLFLASDHLLCASQRQQELWQEWLDRFNLKRDISLVPTGIREEPPVQKKHLLKGAVPGIAASDLVVLWSSGIWPWLDPLTAIRAITMVKNEKVKLVFFGLATVDPSVKGDKQPQLRSALDLAQELGLLDKRVFFIKERTPYTEMGDYLLDGDLALNLHFDTPETTYAFRGRLLDYIWAALPVITTRGDVLSEKIDQYQAGITVDQQNSEQVAAAIEKITADRSFAAACRQNLRQLAAELYWHKVAGPLVAYCREKRQVERARADWLALAWLMVKIYCLSADFLFKYVRRK